MSLRSTRSSKKQGMGRDAGFDMFQGPPKNSYEAANRVPCKAMKAYDMRPHWIKSEDTNPDHVEAAGAEDEEEESLKDLKKAKQAVSEFDEVMEVVLGGQDVIHNRATLTHNDRLDILSEHLGIDIWQRKAMREEREQEQAADFSQHLKEEKEKQQQQQQQQQNQKKHDATAAAAAAAGGGGGGEPLTAEEKRKLKKEQEEAEEKIRRENLKKRLAALHHPNQPHVAILTPPFYGATPINDKYMQKQSLSYKMDIALSKMNEAMVQFHAHNDKERLASTSKQVQEKHDLQREQELAFGSASARLQKRQDQAEEENQLRKRQQNREDSFQNDVPSATSRLDDRIVRQKKLEQGLFTPYHNQSHVVGLYGSPFADPNASGDPRFSSNNPNAERNKRNRRYPEPYAFVIH